MGKNIESYPIALWKALRKHCEMNIEKLLKSKQTPAVDLASAESRLFDNPKKVSFKFT